MDRMILFVHFFAEISRKVKRGGIMDAVRANAREIVERLAAASSEADRQGMARFGITSAKARVLGVRKPTLRAMAKAIGRDHALALELWATGVHEARILACLVADPTATGVELAEAWMADFDSWELCDQCCMNLLDRVPYAWEKAVEWSGREEEFIRRTGFVLMAVLAVHDKKAEDARFLAFLPLIERHAEDPRNFVKKAVNWALRSIGKRNARLREAAMETARRLIARDDKTARWIGRDALRELESKT
jgi:3-methyladenine DNA glycosylase AlkD